jgi:hypothetical protein
VIRERFFLATFATLAASALAAGRIRGTTMTASSSVESAIAKASNATKLTVYHIDAYTTTRTAIRPDQIETYPDVAVHATADSARIASALRALRASDPAATAETREYRWKLVFEDRTGRLLDVYASSFQSYGRIDDTAVAFANDDFVVWLRETYAPDEHPAQSPP